MSVNLGSTDWDSLFTRPPSTFAGEQLPNKLTPLTPGEATQAISIGYAKVTGKKPTEKVLGLLVGQTALETGDWKSLHNFNFGNAKATSSDPYFSYFRCWELENGVKVWYDPPHPACKFAAHKNAAEGAAHYIRVLKRRDHWWKGLHSGTTPGFVEALSTAPKYFTANASEYAHTLDQRLSRFMPLVKQYAYRPSVIGGTVAALALVAAGYYGYTKLTSNPRII